MTVRETMSLDLLNRLIMDICIVTQTLVETGVFDLAALGGLLLNTPSPERQHQSQDKSASPHDKEGSQRFMSDGVHRTVCRRPGPIGVVLRMEAQRDRIACGWIITDCKSLHRAGSRILVEILLRCCW